MAEQLLWNISVKAVGGPQIASSDKLTLDAYDKLAIRVPVNGTANDGNKVTVDLAPDGNKVAVLVVKPAPGTKSLLLGIGTNDVALEAPLVLLGKSSVGLLEDATTLRFTNDDSEEEAVIDILVGRQAT